jgi:hypothetical protein
MKVSQTISPHVLLTLVGHVVREDAAVECISSVVPKPAGSTELLGDGSAVDVKSKLLPAEGKQNKDRNL